MSELTLQKNIAAFLTPKAASLPLTWTAGSGSDNVAFTGLTIDREAFASGAMALSADILVYFETVLTAAKTLSLAITINHSPDGATWTAYATQAATVVATGAGTVTGVARFTNGAAAQNPNGEPGLSLGSAQRYLQVVVTPHLSNTATDTATIAAIGVFGGSDSLPASLS